MHIGNRNFPYPVLNRDVELSDYVAESIFKMEFDLDESGAPIVEKGDIVFKNLHFTITDETLLCLLEQGKLKGAFILECSSSVYRRCFDIDRVPYDLRVLSYEINGNVNASCYLYATEDIVGFKSSGFIEDYSEYSFDIDKFDILAADDGFKLKIDIDPSEDDKVASIFTVVRTENNKDIMTCSYVDRRIVINLASDFYRCYEDIKSKREYNNIAFSIIAIPALAWCLEDVSGRFSSLEEIIDEYSWFNAICKSYKRITGNALSFDEFEEMNKLELAQLVLNSGTCNAIKDFANMILGVNDIQDEEGED